jgi:hypothetical protein
MNADILSISQITDNVFISGTLPLNDGGKMIKKLNIKYIISCLGRDYVSEIHDKIMVDNPDIAILYLPYDDDSCQNLWKKNNNNVSIIKYINSAVDCDKLLHQLNLYNNKPMIEIGYHFINQAVINNKNILVHCMAGVSRSVSVVIYYLMKKHTISYKDALGIIKQKRKIVNPNDSFRLQLQLYQNLRDQFTESHANYIILRNNIHDCSTNILSGSKHSS